MSDPTTENWVQTDGPEPSSSQFNSAGGTLCYSGAVRCFGIFILTLYFVSVYGGLIYLQFGLWRESKDVVEGVVLALPGFQTVPVSLNSWYLFLVLSAGALGSFVHTATSFADYVGNQKTQRSWIVWFLLRPLIGSALALVFYLVLRGGLFASMDSKSLNAYGFAAIAALAGMFSKQATDKLREVFDNLFKTAAGQGDDAREDKLH